MSIGTIDFVDFTPPQTVPLHQVAIRLHAQDHVAIAKTNLVAGTTLLLEEGEPVKVQQFIPSGHKVALSEVVPEAPVRRYGQIIGFASQAIQPGDHVHTQNLDVKDFARDYAFGVDVKPIDYVPEAERRTFMGYKRANGQVGTRNYIALISSVNCSAHTSREIAHYFTPERLAAYPNVDGVIALTHQSGCATRLGGPDYLLLQRTLAGMARHPNIGAFILVGLGCETNQISDLVERHGLTRNGNGNGHESPLHLVIQDEGGIRKTVQAGIAAVEELLPLVNRADRTPQPISELMVGLECGGSDSWSGITANPLLGLVADEIVRQGGTGVLSETPEIYGAEHLLTRRAVSPEVGQKLVDLVHWWEDYTRKMDIEIDNNPSPGNKAGGLTTIYEKSLGAVAKGGSMPLAGVYEYAEPVTARGFTYMDTPGYDPVSVTGLVAGGCTVVLFTTGRGSVFGFKPTPSIKVCTNSTTYNRMSEDMDINAGQILEGVPLETVTAELLDLIIAVASGQPSKSEAQGVGEAEFNPWSIGGTL
jgi:altronate hydrolase